MMMRGGDFESGGEISDTDRPSEDFEQCFEGSFELDLTVLPESGMELILTEDVSEGDIKPEITFNPKEAVEDEGYEQTWDQSLIDENAIDYHWQAIKDHTFLTNGEKVIEDGKEINSDERISYQEAVDRVNQKALVLLDQMGNERGCGFSQEQKHELCEQIAGALKYQQAYTDERGLGEHGIKHIFSNIERTDYALEQIGVSEKSRFAALIAQVYHDEGYTCDGIHSKEVSDMYHDVASENIFRDKHQSFYATLLEDGEGNSDEKKMEAILKAIGTHNINDSNQIIKNINVEDRESENDLIVSAVHISDKCALSENEKMAELYENREIMKVIQSAYESSALVTETQKNLKQYRDNIESSGKSQEEIQEDLKSYEVAMKNLESIQSTLVAKLDDCVEKEVKDPELAAGMKKAIAKDISLQSAKFIVPMNDIAMSKECFTFKETDKGLRAEIAIDVFDYDEAKESMGKELAQRQVGKLLGDLGVPQQEKQEMTDILLESGKESASVELKAQNMIIRVKHISHENLRNHEVRDEVRKEIREGGEYQERYQAEVYSFLQDMQERCKLEQPLGKEDFDDLTDLAGRFIESNPDMPDHISYAEDMAVQRHDYDAAGRYLVTALVKAYAEGVIKNA